MKEQLLKMLQELGNQDVLNEVADLSWRMYQTLKAKGFTDEQAMLLIANLAKQK